MKMIRQYRSPRDGEISAFLSMHASWVKSYGDELRFRPCPVNHCDNDQNPSIQINVKTGLWRCFKCGAVGNWYTLTRAFGSPLAEGDRYKDDYNTPVNSMFKHKFETQKRRPLSGGHYPNLLEYCASRGITVPTLNTWRVSSMGQNNIRWPIYQNDNGTWVVVNSKIRSIDPEAKTKEWFEAKGGPTGLLIGNHLLNVRGPYRAIIFEGQWDAMTATELGFQNVFSLPNGAENVNVGQMLRYIPDHFEIWLAMDMDEAGDRAVEKFYAQLGPEKVARLNLPYKDLNEWYVQNPFLTKEEVERTVVGLTEISKVHNQKVKKNFLDINFEDENDGLKIVTKTPWSKLNQIVGLYEGQTTGLLAPSGRGKSTWCQQLSVFSATNGCSTGLISLEGTRQALSRKIKDIVKNANFESKINILRQNLHISPLEGSRISWRECLDEFSKMINLGCKLLIFDNPDFVCRDDNQAKIQCYAELIEQARAFAVHTIVVWQPNKIDRNSVVNSGNQKGYSQSFQDSDNYINLNIVNGKTVLEVEKNREHGTSGENLVWLKFDEKSRSFYETMPDNGSSNIIDLRSLRA